MEYEISDGEVVYADEGPVRVKAAHGAGGLVDQVYAGAFFFSPERSSEVVRAWQRVGNGRVPPTATCSKRRILLVR